jgi:hypothetical protein
MKKNRWQIAADLMFSKKETKRNLDMAKNVHGTEKAKFDVHVTRMLLGRVKSKSKKDFDVLQNQLLISKSSKSFVDVASKSLAGFRFGVAMENMLKRDIRRCFFKWYRFIRESKIDEDFGTAIRGMQDQISLLKNLVTRQNKSIMAIIDGKMKPYDALRIESFIITSKIKIGFWTTL